MKHLLHSYSPRRVRAPAAAAPRRRSRAASQQTAAGDNITLNDVAPVLAGPDATTTSRPCSPPRLRSANQQTWTREQIESASARLDQAAADRMVRRDRLRHQPARRVIQPARSPSDHHRRVRPPPPRRTAISRSSKLPGLEPFLDSRRPSRRERWSWPPVRSATNGAMRR